MWINTRFQCSHWGNVMLRSAVILNRALGEQLPLQLWLLAGVSSPGSPFSSTSVTAWEAGRGKLYRVQTIGSPGSLGLIQCWQYQEGWGGRSLNWYGSPFATHKRREGKKKKAGELRKCVSALSSSHVGWAQNVCALFVQVVLPLPLSLPHCFPLSSPLKQVLAHAFHQQSPLFIFQGHQREPEVS